MGPEGRQRAGGVVVGKHAVMVVHEGGEDVEGFSDPGEEDGAGCLVIELQVEEDVRMEAVDPLAEGAQELAVGAWGWAGTGAGAGAGVRASE